MKNLDTIDGRKLGGKDMYDQRIAPALVIAMNDISDPKQKLSISVEVDRPLLETSVLVLTKLGMKRNGDNYYGDLNTNEIKALADMPWVKYILYFPEKNPSTTEENEEESYDGPPLRYGILNPHIVRPISFVIMALSAITCAGLLISTIYEYRTIEESWQLFATLIVVIITVFFLSWTNERMAK